MKNSEKVFTQIYREGHWGRDFDGRGISGTGSLVEYALAYLLVLEDFIKNQEIKSVVDVGCGDWSFSQFVNWNNVKYHGIDVVKSIIIRNLNYYGSPNITFEHRDVLQNDLPSADLMLCKDVMQHLTNQDIMSLLNQTHRFKHCLFTNDVDPDILSSENNDIQRGQRRPLDLTKPPFNINCTKICTYLAGGTTKQICHLQVI